MDPPLYKFYFSIVCRKASSRTVRHACTQKLRNSRYESSELYVSCHRSRLPIFFSPIFCETWSDSIERKDCLCSCLLVAVGKEKKMRKENEISINLATVLHNVNGVYLFYGLFRAEPTGGPKISSRRKRRAGRASE